MIRYVEIEGSEMFAWFETVGDTFLVIDGIMAWSSWGEFISDAVHERIAPDKIERYKSLYKFGIPEADITEEKETE